MTELFGLLGTGPFAAASLGDVSFEAAVFNIRPAVSLHMPLEVYAERAQVRLQFRGGWQVIERRVCGSGSLRHSNVDSEIELLTEDGRRQALASSQFGLYPRAKYLLENL